MSGRLTDAVRYSSAWHACDLLQRSAGVTLASVWQSSQESKPTIGRLISLEEAAAAAALKRATVNAGGGQRGRVEATGRKSAFASSPGRICRASLAGSGRLSVRASRSVVGASEFSL